MPFKNSMGKEEMLLTNIFPSYSFPIISSTPLKMKFIMVATLKLWPAIAFDLARLFVAKGKEFRLFNYPESFF